MKDEPFIKNSHAGRHGEKGDFGAFAAGGIRLFAAPSHKNGGRVAFPGPKLLRRKGDSLQDHALSCCLAAPYFEMRGKRAELPETVPSVREPIDGGHIGYHIRPGRHYFSREDWLFFTEYLNTQI